MRFAKLKDLGLVYTSSYEKTMDGIRGMFSQIENMIPVPLTLFFKFGSIFLFYAFPVLLSLIFIRRLLMAIYFLLDKRKGGTAERNQVIDISVDEKTPDLF